MTCCWRGVMDQCLFRGLNFSDSAGASRLVGQTERQSAGRQAGRAAEYQVRPTAADSLAQPRESWGCWECQCTAVLPWLLWLAKQTISLLIMISRVIIYTKVAHSPILRRQSCFPLVKGKRNKFSCVLLKMTIGGKKLFTEKHWLQLCSTANVIRKNL